MAGVDERQRLLVLSGRPIRSRAGERLQGGQGGLGATAAPLRNAEQQCRRRVLWHHFEDLGSLFCGHHGVAVQQSRSVLQRNLNSADRFRPRTHLVIHPV